MKVLAVIKRVEDPEINIKIKGDGSGIETDQMKYVVNPFDEIAVEEAIRLRESGHAEEVIVVTVGTAQSQETLRTALAMGADRAILVEADPAPEPLAVAKLLKAVVEKETPGLVLLGKQAIDGDNNQTGQMLSGLLGWSIGTFASHLEVDDAAVRVTREVDGGLENIELVPPAIVTVDLRLNEPRYASLPNIMKAKKKPLDMLTPETLGVDVSPRLETIRVIDPPARAAGARVTSAQELVDKLRNEAKVI